MEEATRGEIIPFLAFPRREIDDAKASLPALMSKEVKETVPDLLDPRGEIPDDLGPRDARMGHRRFAIL